jgi:hypothetical protein
MINVWFQDSKEKEKIIGQAKDKNDIFNVINKFLNEHNFRSYYIRTWYDPETKRTWYDVGSHVEFFFVKNEE